MLGLFGYMDVVVVGNELFWIYVFFVVEIYGNCLYGCGVIDMKSGLVVMVIVMIEFKELGKLFNGIVKLLVIVGEEVGELGGE